MRLFFYFLLALVLTSAFVFPTSAWIWEEWVATFDGYEADKANAITLDNEGNVYVTGKCNADYTTIKYDPDGIIQWISSYFGVDDEFDEALDIAVDESGNVYVTGQSWGGDETREDFATIKYDSEGNQIWVARYTGEGAHEDAATALAIDAEGSVYVTGHCFNGMGPRDDFTTIKYNAEGEELWVDTYDGPASFYDFPSDIVVDDAGYIYITGQSTYRLTGGSPREWATIKYHPDGTREWISTYHGNTGDEAKPYAIAADQSGNIFVCGYTEEYGSDSDLTVISFSAETGEIQWIQSYAGEGDGSDLAHDIAVDDLGCIYTTGICFNINWHIYYYTYSQDYITIKYDLQGEELWAVTYNGPGDEYDEAFALDLDTSGDVYVTGQSDGPNSIFDYATIKYDTDGDIEWIIRYDGPGPAGDRAYDVGVDLDQNVYVTGESSQSFNNHDYCTIKYSQGVPSINLLVSYVSGSPVPPGGGNLIFDVLLENAGTTAFSFDAWIDISFEGGIPTTVLQRHLSEFLGGGIIDRPGCWYPIPEGYAAGSYTFTGKAGIYPDDIWSEDGFPFVKSGTIENREFTPWTVAGAPDPFDTGESFFTIVPITRELFTAHPNPFNPVTVIRYQLSVDSIVNLAVYDLSGRKVAVLVDSWRSGGLHEVTFDASHLASGVYIFRLTGSDFETSKKMVLMK